MTHSGLDLALVQDEWPAPTDGSIYFNTGSCGRKPKRVLRAISRGWRWLNRNPTVATFFDQTPADTARESLAKLVGADSKDLLLTQNSTQGLQLVMQSFLLNAGDELITTAQEHGSLNSIASYLAQTRGITIRKLSVDPTAGVAELQKQIESWLTEKTRLVALSEIGCFSGWRPDLNSINEMLKRQNILLMIDAAHSVGQGPCKQYDFPLYVGSCHKWLGAPNGTGFLYCHPSLVEQLKPVWLSDRFYEGFGDNPLRKFEYQGTADVVRWLGLQQACDLQMELGIHSIARRQRELLLLLAETLQTLPGARIRTPLTHGETSGILAVTFDPARVKVGHLRDHLWQAHKIWTQPDFCFGSEAHGLRLSCHISITPEEIDKLKCALEEVVE